MTPAARRVFSLEAPQEGVRAKKPREARQGSLRLKTTRRAHFGTPWAPIQMVQDRRIAAYQILLSLCSRSLKTVRTLLSTHSLKGQTVRQALAIGGLRSRSL